MTAERRLTPQAVNAVVVAAVGERGAAILPDRTKLAIRADLERAAEIFDISTAARMGRSTSRVKLRQIAHAAIKLRRLLSDLSDISNKSHEEAEQSEQALRALNRFCDSGDNFDGNLRHLIQAAEAALKSTDSNDARLTFQSSPSAFEWLVGDRLQRIFSTYFGKPVINRKGYNPDRADPDDPELTDPEVNKLRETAFLQFADAVLRALGIKTSKKTYYALESIASAKALIDRRAKSRHPTSRRFPELGKSSKISDGSPN